MNKINFIKIFYYIVTGLFLLVLIGLLFTIIFFYNYSGDKIPSYYFYFTILLLIILGFGIYKLIVFLNNLKLSNVKTINDFETVKWKKIRIKSNEIDVISIPFYREIPKSSSMRIQAFDSLSKDGGVKRVKINRVYLKYNFQNKNYNQQISKTDEVGLKIKLAKVDYVDLFINQNNINEYYFELKT